MWFLTCNCFSLQKCLLLQLPVGQHGTGNHITNSINTWNGCFQVLIYR